MAIAPAAVSAQEIPSVTYQVNVNEILTTYGLTENDRIVLVNCPDTVITKNPLVIMGSGADSLEKQGFDLYTSNNPFDQRTMLTDDVREFSGQSLDNYDLIVVGGPDHNKYTKELIERGIVTYNRTDEKMPGLVLEVAQSPSGHTIFVVGDTAGYPYHKKDLPLNGIIPEKYAPAAAVATGTIFGLIGILLSKLSIFGSLWDKILNFVLGFFTTHAGEVASEKEAKAREVKVKKGIILGITGKEILIGLICALLFAIAFLIADQLELLPGNILLYFIVGGIVSVLHDFGHRLVAFIFKIPSEFKFWGIGTLIMLVTSWLFGTVFAQPGRFLMDTDEAEETAEKDADFNKRKATTRNLALVTLAGPIISFVLCIAFIPLMFFGGIWAEIGLLGFSMNLVTVVYNLMPFKPMDGNTIWHWSKVLWAVLFIPVFLFFVVMTVFVL